MSFDSSPSVGSRPCRSRLSESLRRADSLLRTSSSLRCSSVMRWMASRRSSSASTSPPTRGSALRARVESESRTSCGNAFELSSSWRSRSTASSRSAAGDLVHRLPKTWYFWRTGALFSALHAWAVLAETRPSRRSASSSRPRASSRISDQLPLCGAPLGHGLSKSSLRSMAPGTHVQPSARWTRARRRGTPRARQAGGRAGRRHRRPHRRVRRQDRHPGRRRDT